MTRWRVALNKPPDKTEGFISEDEGRDDGQGRGKGTRGLGEKGEVRQARIRGSREGRRGGRRGETG
jgi:hypothetical protein